ncbi:MAG: AarF/ABC1/UbiB kinase family protein [Cyanobacteria bacterium REEB67]|nr:AarF/ABC1/UbiB kinase family protein [Cyanobacteria bacterium REEB67]
MRDPEARSESSVIDEAAPNLELKAMNGGYDPQLADNAVRLERLVKDKRFWHSLSTLLQLLSGSAIDRLVGSGKITAAEKRKRSAKRVKQALIELGAAFIKLGQFLSVRKDIISDELAEELMELQDRVPPFDYELLKSTIERELGACPETLFKEFETTPIASASIGQVHRARLHDGRPVVVKVQRPDLAEIFYQDLGYMRFIARIGPLLRPKADWQSWLALSDEFGRTVFEEIDYLKEGRNADRVRQMLKEHKAVRVPRIFWKLTGRHVLTMEYLPGTKMDKVDEIVKLGIDPVQLGNNLVAAYMEQVLTHGFFHADPHAGNLAVGADGRIVIYDFGMMGEISAIQREAILGCIASVINHNGIELVKNLTALGVVKEQTQTSEALVRAVAPFIDYYKGKQIKELDFSHLEHDIDQIAMDRALKLPPSLAYLLRTGSSLEGIARSLHPNFSFVDAAKPVVKRWALANPAQAYLALGYLTQGKLFGQKGVFTEERLLRIFSKNNAEEATPGANGAGTGNGEPNQLYGATSAGKRQRSSREAAKASDGEDENLKEMSRRLQEIRKMEAQIYILKRDLRSLHKNRVNLLLIALVWFLTSLIFWGITYYNGERHQFSEYFLIGNGVMVALIIWQVQRPLDLASHRKRVDRSRGRRR